MTKVKVRGNPPGIPPGYLTSQEQSSTTAGAPQYHLGLQFKEITYHKARPHAAILGVILSCNDCNMPQLKLHSRGSASHRNVWPLSGCDSALEMERGDLRPAAISDAATERFHHD